jgi:hypothetical protein
MTLDQWRQQYPEAAAALAATINDALPPLRADQPQGSEARAQQDLRLAAARAGLTTWRNNNGACKDETGRLIRYGLGNDSAQLNRVLKMGDLVGIKPVVITPEHIGQTIGRFWMRELKRPDWRYTGTEHELAQLNAISLVLSLGGDAAFSRGAL